MKRLPNLDFYQQQIIDKLQNLRIMLEKKQNFFNKILSLFFNFKEDKVGFYIYGKVGRGKTTIMEQFYHQINITRKIKLHFHNFMQQIHIKLHEKRKSSINDLLLEIAKDWAKQYDLICLDELIIDNIADAMIVGRLFEDLCNVGINIIITSNTHPNDLYKNGLQRENFLKFIQIIITNFNIENLDGSDDYRQKFLKNDKVFFHPNSEKNNNYLWELFRELTANEEKKEILLDIQGRKITLTHTTSKVLFIDFSELCENFLWTAEYSVISKKFDIIFIQNIPEFNENNRNEAKRFTALIDILYENKVILFATMCNTLKNIFNDDPAFARIESRMVEMQSNKYFENGKKS